MPAPLQVDRDQSIRHTLYRQHRALVTACSRAVRGRGLRSERGCWSRGSVRGQSADVDSLPMGADFAHRPGHSLRTRTA